MATTTQPIHNDQDLIDSRDVIERIAELELSEDELTDEDHEELASLRRLAGDGEDYAPDWKYGETLIRDSYFVEYAKELALDIGLDTEGGDWPFRHIDWEAAAEELEQDYTEVIFDGVTYWVR